MASQNTGNHEEPPASSDPRRWRSAAKDIDVAPPDGAYPISRGAPERKLQRVNRYDRRAMLVHRQQLAPTGTLGLSFLVVDGQPFEFHPGYFIAIQAEADDLDKRRSPYCITSPPGDDGTFRLVVRLVEGGQLSDHLQGLGVGDVINFRGPSGRTMMPRRAVDQLVLLATGVGIGPFLSLCPPLLAGGFAEPIHLYWGLRQVEDICLVDELDALARDHANFDYRISLSEPPPGWTGLRGRLTESVPSLLGQLGNTLFYLVGNGAMIEEVSTVLSDLGVDQRDVYQEAYFNSRYRPDAATLAGIRERFVARDLFSPYAHLEAGLYLPETPVTRSRARRR
ncbi:MAG TPA: FAD-binding oxidoreductase [Acidimicrobiales bacterium]|jgi:ferredoxin-NADP reductase|nr:FAD-binding oxidoreductase [Acidimicrobiales bacterium]